MTRGPVRSGRPPRRSKRQIPKALEEARRPPPAKLPHIPNAGSEAARTALLSTVVGGAADIGISEEFSDHTRRNYASALQALDDWLDEQVLDDASLAEYLVALFESGRAPASAAMVVAAVRSRARGSSQPDPAGPQTARIVVGYRREGFRRGRGRVVGVSRRAAKAAATLSARNGSLIDLRDAAIVAVGSDAMLRVGELVALRAEDITCTADCTLELQVRGTDARVVPLNWAEHHLRDWMQAAQIHSGPLFRRIGRQSADLFWGQPQIQPEGISAVWLRTIIRERIAEVGVRGRVSGNSLRLGAMQSDDARGLDPDA